MTMRPVVEIPLGLIDVPEARLRKVNPLQMEALKLSIEERGLLSPIEVTAADPAGRHILLAGAHRYKAFQELGRKKIPAFVRELKDAHEAQLIEIEENLIRHDLTALDRAVFLARWKAIYTEMTGARSRGRPKEEKAQTFAELPLPFSEAVRERLKMSRRSVEMAVARSRLNPKLIDALVGHPAADNASILDLLKDLPPEEQVRLAQEISTSMSLATLRAQIAGSNGPEKLSNFERFVKLWDKCDADDRARIRNHVKPRGGRGDTQ